MKILKYLFNILLLLPCTCLAYSFNGCSASQQSDLIQAANQAKLYSELVIEEDDPKPFIMWMGFNEINDVKNVFVLIHSVLESQTYVQFSCFCNEEIYAMAWPPDDYRIDICNKFWKAPLDGPNSRTGVLIHELSHFDTIKQTGDFFTTPPKCLAAAKDRTDQLITIDNANSYEYLAEYIAFKNRDGLQYHHPHPVHQDNNH